MGCFAEAPEQTKAVINTFDWLCIVFHSIHEVRETI